MFLHAVALGEFGGLEGIRDPGVLESALARPLAAYGDRRLYPTPFARAAALMDALIRDHGFVDGNKRTAVMAAAFWLEREGYRLEAEEDQLVDAAVSVAEHRLPLKELTAWIEANATALSTTNEVDRP